MGCNRKAKVKPPSDGFSDYLNWMLAEQPQLAGADLTLLAAADAVCLADQSELELFPAAAGILVPYHPDSKLGAKLVSIAASGMTNLQLVSPVFLSEQLLPTLLPKHWR